MLTFTASPTDEQLREFASQLRDADSEEVRAMHEGPTLNAVEASVRGSELSLLCSDKEGPVALFGIAERPGDPTTGHPWMLCTARISRHKVQALRQARESIALWANRFLALEGYVSEKHVKAQAFILALGFQFDPDCLYVFKDPAVRFKRFFLCASP